MREGIVMITGASSGIGLATANLLARQGYRVFGTSRRSNTQDNDGPFEFIQLDVTDPESVLASVEQVQKRTGRIDVLVNNAGYDLYGEAETTTFAEMHDQVDTNFFGAVRMMQAVMPVMRQQRSGKIINISSLGGLLALPFNSAYSASKFALEGYSESMRYELLQYNVYTSLVIAGGIRTETLSHSIREIDPDDSAFSEQRRQMVDHMRNLSASSPLTPADMATQVLRIIRDKRPRLRYVVGSQSRFLITLKNLLPQRLFEQMMINQFNIRKGA